MIGSVVIIYVRGEPHHCRLGYDEVAGVLLNGPECPVDLFEAFSRQEAIERATQIGRQRLGVEPPRPYLMADMERWAFRIVLGDREFSAIGEDVQRQFVSYDHPPQWLRTSICSKLVQEASEM